MRFHPLPIAIFALTSLVASTAVEASSMFLELDGIPGESRVAGRVGLIDLTSVSANLSRIHDAGDIGRSATSANFGDIVVTKHLDKASPLLAQHIASGNVIPTGTLYLTSPQDSGRAYMEYRLRNVLVTRYEAAQTDGDDPVNESVALAYDRIDWHHRRYRPDGGVAEAVSAFWDLESGTGGSDTTGGATSPPAILQAPAQQVAAGDAIDLPLTITDSDTPVAELDVSASHPATDILHNVSTAYRDGSWRVSFDVSATFSGSTTITVTAFDGTDTAKMSFLVATQASETPFENYLRAYYTEAELAEVPDRRSPISDRDLDGKPALLEFVLGTHPDEPTRQRQAITIERVPGSSGLEVCLRFFRRSDDPNLNLIIWAGDAPDNLEPLSPDGTTFTEDAEPSDNPAYDAVEAVIRGTDPDRPLFIRLEARMN